jgi:hypothetical protein
MRKIEVRGPSGQKKSQDTISFNKKLGMTAEV